MMTSRTHDDFSNTWITQSTLNPMAALCIFFRSSYPYSLKGGILIAVYTMSKTTSMSPSYKEGMKKWGEDVYADSDSYSKYVVVASTQCMGRESQ